MIQIGDKVYIKVLDKYNFRGTVMDIIDNEAKVNVPTHYGNKPIVVYKNIDDLIKVPETIKEVEKLKKRGR